MLLDKTTDTDKVMNSQHFGSNPADIWIRIWINPEIRIQIPDHFQLRLDTSTSGRHAVSEHSLV